MPKPLEPQPTSKNWTPVWAAIRAAAEDLRERRARERAEAESTQPEGFQT